MDIKNNIKKLIPSHLLHFMRCIYSKSYRYNHERKICFGNSNPEKTFYVFRIDKYDWGIYTIIYDSILCRLEKVIEKGYIPVFDFQNYRPYMLEDNKSLNLWYRYFEKAQDFVSIEEVYKSRNVIISPINTTIYRIGCNTKKGISEYCSKKRIELFNTYMKASDEICDKVETFFKKNVYSTDVIMGVTVRECYRYCGLKRNEYLGHPKVLSFEEQIALNDKYMQEWGCNKIFLMTDDRECLEKYKDYYKDKLLYYERPLIRYFKNDTVVLEEDYMEAETKGLKISDMLIDYMVEVEILARCNSVISSISSGLVAAIMRNDGKYQNMEILDLGAYE